MKPKPIRFFISYSHQNELWITETLEGNAPNPQSLVRRWRREYPREDGYEFWYDREKDAGIRGGDKWRDSIFLELDRADVAILLISDEFRISGFIRDQELPRIVERASKGELEILPVYVEPAQLEKLDLPGTYQITPGYPTPLSSYLGDTHKMQTALIEVSRALERVVQRVQKKRQPPPPADESERRGSDLVMVTDVPEWEALLRDIPELVRRKSIGGWTASFTLAPQQHGVLVTISTFLDGEPRGSQTFEMPGPCDFHVEQGSRSIVVRAKGCYLNQELDNSETAANLAKALTRLNVLASRRRASGSAV